MTVARLKPAPADGHGLTSTVVDAVYNDLTAGKDPGTIVALTVLKPVEHGEKLTAAGTVRWVRFEAAKVEPVTDGHDAEQVRWQIQQAWDARHSGTMLPLDFDGRSNDEQRRFLCSVLDEWAAEEGLTPSEVGERYRAQFGIDGDEVSPDGSFPHPDWQKAAPHHLREFALSTGALADEPPADVDAQETFDDVGEDGEDERDAGKRAANDR